VAIAAAFPTDGSSRDTEAQIMFADTKGGISSALFTWPRRLLMLILLAALPALLFVQLSGSPARAGQTREQCNECCGKMGYDKYYAEQCRLQCFRTPDHCLKSAAKPVQTPKKKAPGKKAPKRRVKFQWPQPLNLTPGKEWEAAGQILVLNGIGNTHPNYFVALRNVEVVLKEFVRANPAGGALPTAALERILKQYK